MLEPKMFSLFGNIWRCVAKVLIFTAVTCTAMAQSQDLGADQQVASITGRAFPPLPQSTNLSGPFSPPVPPHPGLISPLALPPAVSVPGTNIIEYGIPNNNPSRPECMVYGPDGAYWFTEYLAGKIGRVETVSNTVVQIGLPRFAKAVRSYGRPLIERTGEHAFLHGLPLGTPPSAC